MSKRRNRKNAPNIPQETLERARQQIGQDQDNEPEVDIEEEAPVEVAAPAPVVKAEVASVPRPRTATRKPRRREGFQGVHLGDKRRSSSSAEMARDALDHPTKVVTEGELRQQYGYVLADLRSMGLLAACLIIAMILLAQIL